MISSALQGLEGKEVPTYSRYVPVCVVMGIRVSQFTVESLHACIACVIQRREKAVFANVNMHALNLSYKYPWFRDFLNDSEYVFCDGHGVMLAARCFGKQLPEKITYAAWFPRFAEYCAQKGFSLFLLGGRRGLAEKAAERLTAKLPNLQIAGTHHGYFKKEKDSDENRQVIQIINQANPHVLLVGFGMPVQEKWVMDNLEAIDVNVMLLGGAALDYVSGTLRRPPAWMTVHGLEWLGRMLIEPRRLWKRYLIGGGLFLCRVFSQVARQRRQRNRRK